MKPHLPLLLRKSVLAVVSSLITLSLFGAAYAESQNLTYTGTKLTWDTREENEVYVISDSDTSAAFAQGDNVCFTNTATVTLGENIFAGTVTIEAGSDVTMNFNNFSLDAQRIELRGSLDAGETLHVGNGTTLAIDSPTAALKSNLVLGSDGTLSVNGTASLSGNTLCLQGGTAFELVATSDGRVFDLFTDISRLTNADGSQLTLYSKNNKASNYFDLSKSGTGFLANAILRLNENGTLQLVRYTDIVNPTGYDELAVTTSDDIISYDGSAATTAFRLSADIDIGNRTSSLILSSSGGWAFNSKSVYNICSLSFVENKAKYSISTTSDPINGGAICAGSGSELKLYALNNVDFSKNSAIDNAICTSKKAAYAKANGGAIYGDEIQLYDIGCVQFKENNVTATASSTCNSSTLYPHSETQGGAINCDNITLRSIGGILFDGNSASSTTTPSDTNAYAYARGGAIYGDEITIKDNSIVTFSNNKALSDSSSSTTSYVLATATGGAIHGESLSVTNNEEVVFFNNKSYATATSTSELSTLAGEVKGGAIYASTINFNYNNRVSFSSNVSSNGGAIAANEVTMNDNAAVIFDKNTAYANGGAVNGKVSLGYNQNVTFGGNVAYSNGGAINASVRLMGNESVTFCDNVAYVCGGAISGLIEIANNTNLIFKNNKAYDCGGALYLDKSYAGITLQGNSTVIFSDNSSSDYGGAIYSVEGVNILNNDSVLFEKNVEKSTNGYLLRSIYIAGGYDSDSTSFSAVKGGSIEFRDSIWIGWQAELNLNADYVDENNTSHAQTGDIILTGKYTEQHLNEILTANNVGRNAENSEIINSRTSVVQGMTNLYGGRLRVEDGAVFQGRGLTVHDKSDATIRVENAEMYHVKTETDQSVTAFVLEFNKGTSLEIAGNSTIRGKVNLKAGSSFKLEKGATLNLHETWGDDIVTLTVNGNVLLEGKSTLNANLILADGSILDMSLLNEGSVTLNGALTLGGQVCMGDSMISLLDELSLGDSLTLFTGITEFVLPQLSSEEITERVWLENVFTNIEQSQTYYFDYSEKMGSLSIVAATDIVPAPNPMIPEPTTATLSLLALAGLAARRRRK